MVIEDRRRISLFSSSMLRRFVAVFFGMSLFTGAVAHADASCASLLQDKTAFLQGRGGYLAIQMSIHREDVSWVSYTWGDLYLDAPRTGLTGGGFQVFSDRYAGSQPFDTRRDDRIHMDLSASGLLHIQNLTWGFDTYWDMSCQGELVTSYLPGYGTVTLGFVRWGLPPF